MNRSVNDGYKYSVQKDMLPLLGDERAAGTFLDIVAGAAGVDKEDILGTDLFLYCRGRGVVWGANGEYLSSPKLDDLQCTFANLQGFLAGGHPNTISVYAAVSYTHLDVYKRQVSFPTIQFLQQCRYVHHVGAAALDVRYTAILATVPQVERRQAGDPAGVRYALEWCVVVSL